jgi:putative hemolysin
MNDSSVLPQIALQLALIAVNAVFACAEIAVISLNRPKLEKQASGGDRGAKRLIAITKAPEKFLATIQVAITLAGFLGSAFAANNFAELLSGALGKLPLPLKLEHIQTAAVIIITLILSYVTLVLGELLPKRLAMKSPERIARALSLLLFCASKVFLPLVNLLSVSVNSLLRLLRINPHENEHKVTEEDIRILVESGGESGGIRPAEQEIIENVFEFDNKAASEVMTHRSKVTFLHMDDSDEEWDAAIITGAHNHYPVCGDTFDDITGVLETRAYLMIPEAERNRKNVLSRAVQPPVFLPETQKADVLFRNMKDKHLPFVVVLDEYGGTAGIVTMFDLLEAIVGKV